MTQTPNPYSDLVKQAILLEMIGENEGELTEELAKDLSLAEDKILDTTQRMLDMRDTLLGLEAASQKRIDEEKTKMLSYKKTREVLDERLETVVRQIGPVQLGSRFVAIKASTAGDVQMPNLLPREYYRLVPATPETWVPDGTKILKDLRKGVFIPGATLKSNEKLDVK